jgi:hypothetical protein
MYRTPLRRRRKEVRERMVVIPALHMEGTALIEGGRPNRWGPLD